MAKRRKFIPKKTPEYDLICGEVLATDTFPCGDHVKSDVLMNEYKRGLCKCVYNGDIGLTPGEKDVTLQGFFKPDGYFVIISLLKNYKLHNIGE